MGRLTFDNIKLVSVTVDPSVSGLDLPAGSLAISETGSGLWQKYGSSATDWSAARFTVDSSITTTNATTTTLFTYVPAVNTTTFLELVVVAVRTGGGAGAVGDSHVFKIRGRVKNIAGTVTLSQSTDFNNGDQAWACAFSAAGGLDIKIRVTGALDNNITWNGSLLIKSHSF